MSKHRKCNLFPHCVYHIQDVTVTVKLRFVGQRLFSSMFRKFTLQVKDLTQCQTGGNSNRILWLIFTYFTLFSCLQYLGS